MSNTNYYITEFYEFMKYNKGNLPSYTSGDIYYEDDTIYAERISNKFDIIVKVYIKKRNKKYLILNLSKCKGILFNNTRYSIIELKRIIECLNNDRLKVIKEYIKDIYNNENV